VSAAAAGRKIAANKIAASARHLWNDLFIGALSREHNDANVLSMGGRIVAFGLADEILTLWLATPFDAAGTSGALTDQGSRRQRT